MIYINISQLTLSYAGENFPELDQIPAMQRRRLSALSKMALNTAKKSIGQQKVDYIVWASQYGDEHKTYKILEDVLQDRTPSPTQFSTSVHNAVAGLYSILCQDATPSISLCANWSEGLVEAYTWLKSHSATSSALVVFYDDPLPKIYEEYEKFQGFAMAAVIQLQQPNCTFDLEILNHQPEPKYKDALDFEISWNAQAGQAMRVWSVQ